MIDKSIEIKQEIMYIDIATSDANETLLKVDNGKGMVIYKPIEKYGYSKSQQSGRSVR